MKKIGLFFLSVVTISCIFMFTGCNNESINATKYYLNNTGELIVEFDNNSTENLGNWGTSIINSIGNVTINENGYFVINGVTTEIEVDYNTVGISNDGFYVIDGVKTDIAVNYNSVEISDDGFYVVNGIKTNISATAVYTVSFDAGFTAQVGQQNVKDGYKANKPELSRKGYSLVGWFYNDEEWRFNSDVVMSNMTLSARWEANTYEVKFENEKGDNPAGLSATFDSNVVLPELAEVQGYTFNGWYNGNKLVSNGKWTIDENVTLQAKWTRDTYKVYFNTNCEIVINPLIVDSYSAIENLPCPERTDYEFVGWYLNDKLIETPYDFKEGDIHLTALWKGISDDYDFVEESIESIRLERYKGNDEFVTVPKTLGGKNVTTISANCFKDNNQIKQIAFNSNIINFEFKSIVNCEALESLVISSDLEIDIVYLFGGEANIPLTLKNIYFCEGSINADSSFFANLTSRTFELWTNNDLKVLKENAFYRCDSITKLHLNEGLTKIEKTAIWEMKSLTFINIPSTVTDIGWSNFGNCSKLLYLIAPKTIKNTTHQSLVASSSVVLVEYESFPSTWDSTVFGYDTTSSRMDIFYGFESLKETDNFLYALCKVGTTKRCIIIQRYNDEAEYPEFLDEYPVTFTNSNYTAPKQ